VLLEITASEDETFEVGAQLCVIGAEGEGGGSAPAQDAGGADSRAGNGSPAASSGGGGSSASGGSSVHSGGPSYDAVGTGAEPHPSAPPAPAQAATSLAGADPAPGGLAAPAPMPGPADVRPVPAAPAMGDSPAAAGQPVMGGSGGIDRPDTDEGAARGGTAPRAGAPETGPAGGGMYGTYGGGSGGGPGGAPLPGVLGGHSAGTPAMPRDHAAPAMSYDDALTESWPEDGEPESPQAASLADDVLAARPFSSADGESPGGQPRDETPGADEPGPGAPASDEAPSPPPPPDVPVDPAVESALDADERSEGDSAGHAAASGPAVFIVPPRMGGGGRPSGRPRGGGPAGAARSRPRPRPAAPAVPGAPDGRQSADLGPPDLPVRLRAAYGVSEATPAGRSLYGPGDQSMRELARRVRPDAYRYVLDGHGTRAGMWVGDQELSVGDIADVVRNDPAWDGRDLVLLSCGNVRGGAAFPADLARDLGVPVVAPDGLVWSDGRGRVFSASAADQPDRPGPTGGRGPTWPPDRGWRTFHPDSVPAPPGPDAVVVADDGGGDVLTGLGMDPAASAGRAHR